MNIGLVSDTHGSTPQIQEAAALLHDRTVHRLIHTGDVTRVSHLEPLLDLEVPLHLVFGNCDFNTDSFQMAEENSQLSCEGSAVLLELDGHRFGLTHGHYDSHLRELASESPDYLVHGHTHERRDERRDGTRYLNPGSVKPPDPSIAVLNSDLDEVEFLRLTE